MRYKWEVLCGSSGKSPYLEGGQTFFFFSFLLLAWNVVDMVVRAQAAILSYERAMSLKESQTMSEDTNPDLDCLPLDFFYVRKK